MKCQIMLPGKKKKKKKNQEKSSYMHFEQIFIGEKEKWLSNVCTKFQIPSCSSFSEIFDTNFLMHYIGVIDGKKMEK